MIVPVEKCHFVISGTEFKVREHKNAIDAGDGKSTGSGGYRDGHYSIKVISQTSSKFTGSLAYRVKNKLLERGSGCFIKCYKNTVKCTTEVKTQ